MSIEDVQLNWVHSPMPTNDGRYFAVTPFGAIWVTEIGDGEWETRCPYEWETWDGIHQWDGTYFDEREAKDAALRLFREMTDKAFAHA